MWSDPTVCARCREEIGPADSGTPCASITGRSASGASRRSGPGAGCGMTRSVPARSRARAAAQVRRRGPLVPASGRDDLHGGGCDWFRDRGIATLPGAGASCRHGNGTICLETGALLPAGPCPGDCGHRAGARGAAVLTLVINPGGTPRVVTIAEALYHLGVDIRGPNHCRRGRRRRSAGTGRSCAGNTSGGCRAAAGGGAMSTPALCRRPGPAGLPVDEEEMRRWARWLGDARLPGEHGPELGLPIRTAYAHGVTDEAEVDAGFSTSPARAGPSCGTAIRELDEFRRSA